MDILTATALFFLSGGKDGQLQREIVEHLVEGTVTSAPRGYRGRNRDFNRHHLRAAQCWDTNFSMRLPTEELFALHAVAGLEQVTDNSLWLVAPMTHSRPLLAGPAHDALKEIAQLFQQKLSERELPPYRIILTSGTRSRASQARLEKVNSNAASTTAHWYGYTFDIAYNEFVHPYFFGKRAEGQELKDVLDETLRELRAQKKIWVLGERRQACFHITVQCEK